MKGTAGWGGITIISDGQTFISERSSETPSKSSQDTTSYVSVGAQTAFGSSADALLMRSTLRRVRKATPTPQQSPQVTYLSGVTEADLRATDPADAAPAAAPSIAPGSDEPDGLGVPKTPRHRRKVAGEWGQRHVPTTDSKLSVCEVLVGV